MFDGRLDTVCYVRRRCNKGEDRLWGKLEVNEWDVITADNEQVVEGKTVFLDSYHRHRRVH